MATKTATASINKSKRDRDPKEDILARDEAGVKKLKSSPNSKATKNVSSKTVNNPEVKVAKQVGRTTPPLRHEDSKEQNSNTATTLTMTTPPTSFETVSGCAKPATQKETPKATNKDPKIKVKKPKVPLKNHNSEDVIQSHPRNQKPTTWWMASPKIIIMVLVGLVVLSCGTALFSMAQVGELQNQLEAQQIKHRQGLAHWKQVAQQAEAQLEGFQKKCLSTIERLEDEIAELKPTSSGTKRRTSSHQSSSSSDSDDSNSSDDE